MSVKNRLPLELNLQYFAESSNPEGGDGGTDGGSKETPKQESKENMIPKSRFDEVNTKYKEMESQLSQIMKEREEQEQARIAKEKEEAEKRGEYEKLYHEKAKEAESLLAYQERATELETLINSMVESKLSTIPEDYHDLIPSNLTPEAKLDWISKAEAKGILKAKTDEVEIGKRTNPKSDSKRDTSTMSAMEKLLMGYGRK
ncbi:MULTISPECIES: hypothetical protein [unclassified Exiguobacterium]|uniref:hypothetical protein n=1 Tax=unclassified Exiguobacterium TaxID=2644629 RepID=UPI001BE739C1|nr:MULTISPECIES: hypothetical protein [unclassified Exiguobacterium]